MRHPILPVAFAFALCWLQPSIGFSPLSVPLTRSSQGSACSLQRVQAGSFQIGAETIASRHITSLRSGKGTNAELADLNFNLWDAAKNGETEKIESLAKQGANVNYYDPEMLQCTALQWAANNGHVDCISKLVELGASVHPTNQFGWTALHHAANWGYLDCVKKLVELGADANARSQSGKSPMQCAAFKGFTPVVQYLRDLATDQTGISTRDDSAAISGFRTTNVYRGNVEEFGTWDEKWDVKNAPKQ